MRKYYWFVLFVLIVTTFVGCGTIRGIGDDISTVGRWITGRR